MFCKRLNVKCRFTVFFLIGVLLGILQLTKAFGTQAIYWTDSGTCKIQCANSDGSEVVDLITESGRPFGIAIDADAGKMYWSSMDNKKIRRANLDGSGVEDIITSSLIHPRGIALDVVGGKIYWTDIGTDKIQCANLDGSDIEDLVITTGWNSTPLHIALDVGDDKMYWTNADVINPRIQCATLDGSEVADLITKSSGGIRDPIGIALDIIGGKIYWVDSARYSLDDKIQCANLDGSDVEDIITSGLSAPCDLAIDLAVGKMYWSDVGSDKIQCANLNGTGVEDLITLELGVSDIGSIALGPIFKQTIEATIEIAPKTLNLKSKGKWITCYIWLPEEYNVADINSYSVFLEDEIQPDRIWFDEDQQVAITKFSRSDLCQMLIELGELGEVELTITGELIDGTRFKGSDTIRIIHHHGLAPLVSHWLGADCIEPDWCDGLDFNQDSVVNFVDFALLNECRMELIEE